MSPRLHAFDGEARDAYILQVPNAADDAVLQVHFRYVHPDLQASSVDWESGQIQVSKTVLQTYQWDHRQRLTEVVTYGPASGGGPAVNVPLPAAGGTNGAVVHVSLAPTTSKRYQYDVHHQLIGTETFQHPGAYVATLGSEQFVTERGQIVAHYESADGANQTHLRLWGPGVDNLLAVETDGAPGPDVLWTLTDQQGTITHTVGRVSGEPTPVKVHYSDDFGLPTNANGQLTGIDTFRAGRDYDDFTNLYYNRARWYDPIAGRWLSEDPIGFAGGDTNLYRYVGNWKGKGHAM